jgi:ATP-binding cassette subfamily F protein 3
VPAAHAHGNPDDPVITLRNLSLQRGGRPLFEGASLAIHAGQKVGLTGANGSGKSSLFALILGEVQPDAGELDLPGRITVGHVEQETPAVGTPAIELVMDGDGELRALEADLRAAEAAGDGARIGAVHGQLEAIGAYAARARAGALLHGLGFSAEEQGQPVASFSGGWRVRLNLARALMCRSDLLLLDEPTNHLDLDAVLWLEQWLLAYPGTLILVSHDRDFLDRVVDWVAHIEGRGIDLYRGNYAQFERTRAARLAARQATYDRQQREVAHIRAFVDRFRAKATKARQAQSRLKALERMELVAAVHADSPLRFGFGTPERCPNPLLRLEGVSAGYGDRTVLREVVLGLDPGTRIGLLGRNGAGKSTLIKVLAGVLPPQAGRREEGDGLAVGYFAQHQLEQLDPAASPLLHLTRLAPGASEQALRGFLGGFGFSGDDALRPAGPFSGGEKARLALALLAWGRPNLLLLDEPTNHLDLAMRDALNLALQEYVGALVVVSHDRYLLRTLTDRFLLVAEGRVRPFDGDLDDYRAWLAQDARAEEPGNGPTPAADRRAQRRAEAEARNRLAMQRRPLERQLAELEARLAALTAERDALDAALADPSAYDAHGKERLRQTLVRRGELARMVETVEQEWMALAERIEGLSAE